MLKICRTNSENCIDLSIDNVIKGSWINLVNPTPEEILQVSKITKLPLDALKAALDEEERSRTEIEENYILVITNLPVMRGEDSYDTLPVGIIVTTDYIVTVCLECNPVLLSFNECSAKTFNTAKKTRFLFQILYRSAALYLKYLKQINRRTDEIEKDLRISMKNREIFQLLELQKGLTYFMASLRSNGIVLERLLRLRSNNQLQHLLPMFEEDEDLLEDVIIENKQAIEMVEMYSNILSGMMDAFASIISNNLNIVMKFLASITILLAIPTVISSMFGMNVWLPFNEEDPLGFIYVLLISLAVTGASAYALWKKDMF